MSQHVDPHAVWFRSLAVALHGWLADALRGHLVDQLAAYWNGRRTIWPKCALSDWAERMLRDHDLSLVSPMCKVSNIRCRVSYSIAIVLVHPISPLSSWDYADSRCS